MALITETNQQYYQGSQGFRGAANGAAGQEFTTTFDTNLVFGSFDPTNANYTLNNFYVIICRLARCEYACWCYRYK